MINRNIPIPLYYQLIQEIKGEIESGVLQPGDAIPTEMALMERYEISRATVRQAIQQLVNEGYLRRVKAKGTFVNSPPEKPKFIGSLKGFAREMQEKGVACSTRVLEKRIIPAPVKVAEKLGIASENQVFNLKRLRFIQDEPVLISNSYIPAQICRFIENEDFENKSLYDILENKYNLILHHGKRDFEPVMPSSKEEVELLGVSPRTPILYVEGVVNTEDGTPVEYVKIKMRGKFTVDLLQSSIK